MILTLDAPVEAVRVEVTVPAGHNRLAVSRVGPSGISAYVRNYAPALVAPGLILARDFEAPIGVPLTYKTESWNTATPGTVHTETATFTVPDDGCTDTWLTDLVRAQNTFQVIVAELASLDYEYPSGVFQVIDRRTPVVASDIANTPTFELSLLTETDDQRERARAILGNGVPVLLRTPPANGIGNLYFAVTGWSEQRVVNQAREPARMFVAACVQVDRPDPVLFAPIQPVTYEDVHAEFGSYAEMTAERSTYDAVLYGYADVAEDVVPWPPIDI